MSGTKINPPSGDWRVVAASVRGAHHLKRNQPCQDALQWRTLPRDLLAVVLADGAGSASLAEIGADVAVRAAMASLDRCLNSGWPASDSIVQNILTDALEAARRGVLQEAETRQSPPRELASTLLVFVADPEHAAAAQIGDGGAILVNREDQSLALTRPYYNEYLNETTFLISDAAVEQAQVQVRAVAVKQVAVFSDGLQMVALKMPGGTPHIPFFAPLFSFADAADDEERAHQQLAAFLQSPRLTQRADDDLTLLLASLRPRPNRSTPR